MDYQMPGMDGITFSKKLRKNGFNGDIIFVSGFPEIVFDCFEINIFRFLKKPIKQNDLFAALDAFLYKNQKNYRFIILKNKGMEIKINYDDILYIEAFNKNSIIHLKEHKLIQAKSLSEIEKSLSKNNFIRTHRSFIVNLKYIKMTNKSQIYLDNGEIIKLSRNNFIKLKNMYNEFLKISN